MLGAKEVIGQFIEAKRDKFIHGADCIWETPETRFETKQSVEQHYKILEEEGFSLEKGIAGMDYAYVATYGSGSPVIGILAEYDALSNLSQVADKTKKEAIIPGGNGHGCGHNLLGIGALAGAVGIKDYMAQNSLPGTIKLFGCPAEESGYGKAFMARDGIFNGIDCALTWHPMDTSGAWDSSSLAVFQIYYHFKGISSHAAAAPESGRSALDAAELMNVGVQFLREHIISSARVHYAFTDVGGESPNVVQPTASLYYFIRAPKIGQAKEIFERVNKVAQGAAMMTETEVEIEFNSSCANYIPNKPLTTAIYNNLKSLGPIPLTQEEKAFEQQFYDELSDQTKEVLLQRARLLYPNVGEARQREIASMPINTELMPLTFATTNSGSTDVGDVSWVVPTGQILVGCEPQGAAPHSWQWVANGKSSVAHKGMLMAGKSIAMTAYDLLTNPSLLAEAKAAHKEDLGGENYQSAIPADVKPQ